MDDLIRRSDAVAVVKHAWAKGLEPSQYIENVPAVDAVEVVRCAYCKYWDRSGINDQHSGIGHCGLTGRYLKETDYCSSGQRREDGDT